MFKNSTSSVFFFDNNTFNHSSNSLLIQNNHHKLSECSKMNISLPSYEYLPEKIVLIPFDVIKSNNGKFETLDDAILYIATHCLQFHNAFSKQLMFSYSKFCQILSLIDGGYISLASLDKKLITNAFIKVNRRNYIVK